jgi:sugar phosphate isomerase/epimerase
MSTQVTRRRFLVEAGCICGGVAAAAQLNRSLLAAEDRPVWLASCCDSILRPTGHEDSWSALRAVQAEGVQLDVAEDLTLPNLFHPTKKYTLATAAGIEQIAADAKTAGQQITSFCMHNHFEAQPDFEVEFCSRLAEVAKTMGVSMIRIDLIPEKLARPEFLKLSIETLKRVITATASTGVLFGIENHSNTTNDPAFLHPLFDGVGSKRVGLTLDIGNFYWYGHPLSKLYELYETFAPRVFHTHCKSMRYPAEEREKQRPMGWKYDVYGCPIYEGDIDYVRVAAILQKAGYHNDFCVEDEFLGKLSPAEATKTLAKEIEYLKAARAKV